MATATKKARAAKSTDGGAIVASDSAAMEVLIVEDNCGDYHWTLLDRDGDDLARSPNFASYQDAEAAARVTLAGAGSARLDHRAANDGSLPS